MKINNLKLTDLKEKYNTPLYIYDENKILSNIKVFKDAFKHENFNTKIIYASKAFLTKYMAKLIKDENMYLDCVSRGEIYTALKAGFNPKNIYLHGNNKTIYELKEAIEKNIGTIILDNLEEAKMLLNIKNKKHKVNVMLRVNLSFEVNTHKYIKTSYEDSKFGVLINEDTIKMIKKLKENEEINFIGLHSHMGSQILEEESFITHTKLMLDLYKNLKDNYNINLPSINLGGGFGIKYLKEDKELNLNKLLKNMVSLINKYKTKYNLLINEVLIEPGRSIIGNAGYTLYTINQIKKTPHLNYLFVDGSMNDNLRTALYNAKYEAKLITNNKSNKLINYKVAGKACESGDILINNILLKEARVNDLLLVENTGAYHYSMANNYNRLLIPAVVFIKDGIDKLVVRRQTLDDLIKYDL